MGLLSGNPEKEGKKHVAKLHHDLILADLAPGLIVKRQTLEMIEKAEGEEAKKGRKIIAYLEDINKVLHSFIRGDEVYISSMEGHHYEELIVLYKIVGNLWSRKKRQPLLVEAANLLHNAASAKTVDNRNSWLNKLIVHNLNLIEIWRGIILKDDKIVDCLESADDLFHAELNMLSRSK